MAPMTKGTGADLGRWMETQARIAAGKLAGCISATGLTKRRVGFGQTVVPAAGSVLASPEIGSSDTEPDYFFDWTRNSAVVLDAVLALHRSRDRTADWPRKIDEIVRFNLDLANIDGARFLHGNDFRAAVAPDYLQFVRPDAELAAVQGSRVGDEVRYNADGTLDFIKWSRPQHDGPALRALVAMRIGERIQTLAAPAKFRLDALILGDLDYTCSRAGQDCIDIWEEELGRHYYTSLVQLAALRRGALWMEAARDQDRARRYAAAAALLERPQDAFWSGKQSFYRSRILPGGGASAKELDISVILAVLHAGIENGPHSVLDRRVHATLLRLEALFAAEYRINRAVGRGLSFGRYKGDKYVSGGAYFFSTFAAAEFHYRRAGAARAGAAAPAVESPEACIAAGDAIMWRTREFIPASGELSEQFDQATGEPSSARNLSWSYAAFVTAWLARNDAGRTP